MTDDRRVDTLYSGDSKHHKITVESHDGLLELRFSGRSQGWTDAETRCEEAPAVLDYLQVPLALKPDATDVLVIGLGGGVLPRRLLALYPHLRVDVVELDPEVVRVCEEFFGLPDDDRLHIITSDGRAYLESCEKCYDAIMIDAFHVSPTAGYAVPFVFVTREFFALMRSRLKPGGAAAINVVGVRNGRGSGPLRRFCKGVAETFASWHLLLVSASKNKVVGRRNYVVVACDAQTDADTLRARMRGRGDGTVPLDELPAYADDVLEAPFTWRGVRPYSDADAPADGLMRG